jgi:hypothetical protein
VRNLPPGLPRGTPIEVEYRYGGNGCISVSARVPSARQSAHVELQREGSRSLDDLETWKTRLCGRAQSAQAGFSAEAAASSDGAAVNAADRVSVMKRLDALYGKCGAVAVKMNVPDAAEGSRLLAMAAADEVQRTARAVHAAEVARQAAVSSTDVIRLDAALSQARTAARQAEIKRDFAHVVLGRDCVRAAFCPLGMDGEVQEIHRWQKCLEKNQASR